VFHFYPPSCVLYNTFGGFFYTNLTQNESYFEPRICFRKMSLKAKAATISGTTRSLLQLQRLMWRQSPHRNGRLASLMRWWKNFTWNSSEQNVLRRSLFPIRSAAFIRTKTNFWTPGLRKWTYLMVDNVDNCIGSCCKAFHAISSNLEQLLSHANDYRT